MPLYEYQCDSCGHRFEQIQKFSDPAIETCPSCGGQVHKLPSSPAIQFKGSGFYITDYAKKDASTAKKEDTSAARKDDHGSSRTAADSAKSAPAADSTSSSASPAPAPPAPTSKDS